MGYIAPIPLPFHLLNTKMFENEFQVEILHPKTMLGTKFHRNQMIFIFFAFLVVQSHSRDYIAPI